ncbi:DNA-binding protein [bacterium]|nr:MAG: DNA-binding protein [bacterium]
MKRFALLVWISAFLLMVCVSGAYAASAKPAEPPPPSALSGKVMETVNGGGYTYVRLEKSGKKIWVAVPEMKVAVGQEISFQPGMTMDNFTSKTLNRTFQTIVFSNGVIGQQRTESIKKSEGQKQTEAAANKAVKVKKASGPNGFTVAELYEKSTDLDKKDVVVRGRVVKVSAEIMGKNWIHLQDGSGDPSKGTNDIVVTSRDLPAVGDTVTAKGALFKDKDFGQGYSYSVIVEQASVKK